MDKAVALQLDLEDFKDWSCRSNLRLRGLPEAMGMEQLAETITAVFHKVLDPPPRCRWSWIGFTEP